MERCVPASTIMRLSDDGKGTGANIDELECRSLPANLRVVKAIARITKRVEGALPAFAASLARKIEAVVDAGAVAVFARRLRPDVIHFHSTNTSAIGTNTTANSTTSTTSTKDSATGIALATDSASTACTNTTASSTNSNASWFISTS